MLTQQEALEFLKFNGYLQPKVLVDGRYAAIYPLLLTSAIIVCNPVHVEHTIDERYCYETTEAALAAYAKWDGTGEPEGWHRHIPTGRRRKKGDPLSEYINP